MKEAYVKQKAVTRTTTSTSDDHEKKPFTKRVAFSNTKHRTLHELTVPDTSSTQKPILNRKTFRPEEELYDLFALMVSKMTPDEKKKHGCYDMALKHKCAKGSNCPYSHKPEDLKQVLKELQEQCLKKMQKIKDLLKDQPQHLREIKEVTESDNENNYDTAEEEPATKRGLFEAEIYNADSETDNDEQLQQNEDDYSFYYGDSR